MEPQITTQPLPPLGTTTTPTPLSIEGTLTNNLIEGNVDPQPIPSLSCKNSIYYGKFEINNTNAVGHRTFDYSIEFPLGDTSNGYYKQPENNGTLVFLCPWSLIPVWFSRQTKIDYALVMQPVKISDSRVSVDSIFRYKQEKIQLYNTDAFAHDTYSHYIDDNDGLISMTIPAFWNTNFVPTRFLRVLSSNVPPAFLPKTQMSLFIRSPYVPTLMHPDHFDMLIYLVPLVSVVSTMVGATRVARSSPNADNYLPLPYVFNRRAL